VERSLVCSRPLRAIWCRTAPAWITSPALPSSASAAAHDEPAGNAERLKAELEAKGLSSRNMTFYTLYRLREFSKMDSPAFRRRTTACLPADGDLGRPRPAGAGSPPMPYQCMARGEVLHAHIRDDPDTESERRQMFFAAAIGLPVFYVKPRPATLFPAAAYWRRPSARAQASAPHWLFKV